MSSIRSMRKAITRALDVANLRIKWKVIRCRTECRIIDGVHTWQFESLLQRKDRDGFATVINDDISKLVGVE